MLVHFGLLHSSLLPRPCPPAARAVTGETPINYTSDATSSALPLLLDLPRPVALAESSIPLCGCPLCAGRMPRAKGDGMIQMIQKMAKQEDGGLGPKRMVRAPCSCGCHE